MQLLPILLIAVVLAADAGLTLTDEPAGSWWLMVTIACLPPVLILCAQWVSVRMCLRAATRLRSPRPFMTTERLAILARLLMIVNHAVAVLVFGWLQAVREMVGDLVLVDEVIAIAPPLAGAVLTWAVHYPVERRLREALLIRRLDEGRPIHEMPSRRRYVWRQAQLHVLLLLVPVLLILGAAEMIHDASDRWLDPEWAEFASQAGTLAAGVTVFVFAPLLAMVLFSTRPLPEGELRESLLDVCRRHRVKVRDLLVWKTDGAMINAAVMGLIAPLRLVLITDALLETMRADEVRAVMAHEIGHVRRHHMPWLVLCLVALLAMTEYLVIGPLMWMDGRWIELTPDSGKWVDIVVTSAIVAAVLLGFGWISRRFERQADSFAAQHLSGLGHDDTDGDEQPITHESVHSLRSALLTICRLNAVDPARRSWRHGSIAWRIAYLESIVGTPLGRLPIDRVIRRLKIAAATCVITAIAIEAYLYDAGRASEATAIGPSADAAAVEAGDAPMSEMP